MVRPFRLGNCWDACNAAPPRLAFGPGCEALDALLGGGVSACGITEISGVAGTGKTQMAMQLLLQAQLPRELGGLGGKAIYLCCGEGNFPIRRLLDLAEGFEVHHRGKGAEVKGAELLENVLIERVRNSDELQVLVKDRLGAIIAQNSVRLVVLDSIAGLLRNEFVGKGQSIARARVLQDLGQAMKALSDVFGTSFVVTNQVTADAANLSGTRYGLMAQDHMPAMGLSWSECVGTSLLLTRSGARGAQAARRARLLFSPTMPAASAPFAIERAGVRAPLEEPCAALPAPVRRAGALRV